MPSQATGARRSNNYSSSYAGNVSYSPAGTGSRFGTSYSMVEEARAGASSSPRYQASRSMTTPMLGSSMGSSNVLSPTKTMPNLMHAKLHKRGSGSSGVLPTIATSVEPFPDITTPVQSPKAKAKPYLRKLSSTKDDQGRIDLSKSLAENERLAGLGIQDLPVRSSTDVVFAPKASHARTTSVGSQMSNTSSSYKPQPFVHPMRQAPRPYTPPTTRPRTTSQDDDDFVEEEDYRPSFTFRTRRSMSNSSQQIAPTPLSQTITAADLGALPRLANGSQSNLSTRSATSNLNGSRRNTGRSQQDLAISPSSRTSFDRTYALGPRRSDTEAQTRDERIQAARRKFQEKEAGKDRKAEKEAIKRREVEEAKEKRQQERQRGKSDASERSRLQRPGTGNRTGSALGMVSSLAYESTEPEVRVVQSEKQPRLTQTIGKEEKSVGFFSRLFSCGSSRR